MITKSRTAKACIGQELIIERTLSAPVAVVWKALTDADAMRRWYFDLESFEPRKGFEFEFTVEHEGTTYCHCCRVTEVIPQRKIAYTWRYAGKEGDSLVTFELFGEGKETKLRLTHAGLDTFPKLPAYARENFMQGWTELIGTSLKDYLAAWFSHLQRNATLLSKNSALSKATNKRWSGWESISPGVYASHLLFSASSTHLATWSGKPGRNANA
jgi:uncharacterized protein YndB with AHSA1/START domain